MWIQIYDPVVNSFFSFPCSRVIFYFSVICFFPLCPGVFTFSFMLSVHLYVSVSSIWANTHQPSAHPVDHTVLPCLLATRLEPAAGCYLSVRARDFSRLEWGDFHVWCVFQSPPPPPLSLSLPSHPSPLVLLGCNMQERPCCRKALVQIPVHSPPQRQWLFETGKTWKSRITVTDHWMCFNKRKFWGSCWKRTGGNEEKDRKEVARKGKKKKER